MELNGELKLIQSNSDEQLKQQQFQQQQQIAINQNIIALQNTLFLQSSKVVVHLMGLNNIQLMQQMDKNQTRQLVIQQRKQGTKRPLRSQNSLPVTRKVSLVAQHRARVAKSRAPTTSATIFVQQVSAQPHLLYQRRPPPRPQYQQQIDMTQATEAPERKSAKMLVILDNGEQQLITFTFPKETCIDRYLIWKLLELAGIQVGANRKIECIKNLVSEIEYTVKIGNFMSRNTAAMTKATENYIHQQQRQKQQLVASKNSSIVSQQQVVLTKPEAEKTKSLEPIAKDCNGFFAVCAACGFSGADHAKCERCDRIFPEDPPTKPMQAESSKKNQFEVIKNIDVQQDKGRITTSQQTSCQPNLIEAPRLKKTLSAVQLHFINCTDPDCAFRKKYFQAKE